MEKFLKIVDEIPQSESFVVMLKDSGKISSSLLTRKEKLFLVDVKKENPDKSLIQLSRLKQQVFVVFVKIEESLETKLEESRRLGSKVTDAANENFVKRIYITSRDIDFETVLAFAEGIVLTGYRFLKYLSDENKKKHENSLQEVNIVHSRADYDLVKKLVIKAEYTFYARDLVNEPPSSYNAKQFAELISAKASLLGIKTEVFGKRKIESLKLGGLLAVNRGSIDPPSFTVMEWKPENAGNKKPVVLVGKGILFDTGGMNLKTGSYMDGMKSDMAGAALMVSVIMALAALNTPLYVVALIPATDNRVDGNALLPDDIITMHDGTTVEIKNTDAEGRLILADALSYAKRYDPQLVIEASTLTGAAERATGSHGIVAMQTKASVEMNGLKEIGDKVYERIVEFPLWKEYKTFLNSDVADIKNIGGAVAGAITAGKFLEHFTEYPFIHLDIAGTSFTDKRNDYIPKGATGKGVRLLTEFLINKLVNKKDKV